MRYKLIDPDKEYLIPDIYNYVIDRDNRLCQFCGKLGENLHHVIFRSHGGKDKPNNLVLACNKCHTKIHRYEHTNTPIPNQENILAEIRKREARFRRMLV